MAGDHSDTQGDFQDPALSRSAMGLSPFGKLDRELKTHIDEHTYGLILRECADIGVLPGVFLRELLYKRFHKKTLSEITAERMSQRIDGEGPIEAQGARHG